MQALAVVLLRILAFWMLAENLLPYLGSAVYGLTTVGDTLLPSVFPLIQASIWLVFVIALLFGAPRIARSITPSDEQELITLSQPALVKVGFIWMAIFFVVTGLSGLTVDVPMLVQQVGSAAGNLNYVIDWNISWFVAGPALTKLIAGLLLWRWVVRH